MHVDRIRRLASHVETLPHVTLDHGAVGAGYPVRGYTMEAWTYACGSPACVAGWAREEFLAEADEAIEAEVHLGDAAGVAEVLLGLSREQADALFLPDRDRWLLPPEQAARTLRHLADTGDVDWTVSA